MKVFINDSSLSIPNGNMKMVPSDGARASPVRLSSSLQINIPQVDVVETPREKEDKTPKPKSAVTRGRRTPMSSRTAVKTG